MTCTPGIPGGTGYWIPRKDTSWAKAVRATASSAG